MSRHSSTARAFDPPPGTPTASPSPADITSKLTRHLDELHRGTPPGLGCCLDIEREDVRKNGGVGPGVRQIERATQGVADLVVQSRAGHSESRPSRV